MSYVNEDLKQVGGKKSTGKKHIRALLLIPSMLDLAHSQINEKHLTSLSYGPSGRKYQLISQK